MSRVLQEIHGEPRARYYVPTTPVSSYARARESLRVSVYDDEETGEQEREEEEARAFSIYTLARESALTHAHAHTHMHARALHAPTYNVFRAAFGSELFESFIRRDSLLTRRGNPTPEKRDGTLGLILPGRFFDAGFDAVDQENGKRIRSRGPASARIAGRNLDFDGRSVSRRGA